MCCWNFICRYTNGLTWVAPQKVVVAAVEGPATAWAAGGAATGVAEGCALPRAPGGKEDGVAAIKKSEWRGYEGALPVRLTKKELLWMRDEIEYEAMRTGQGVLCQIKEQRHGDLFYIPTGLPHSVANGEHSTLKLAFDFIDPRKPDILARNAVIQKKIIPRMMGIGQAEDYSNNSEATHTEVGDQVFIKLMEHNIAATARLKLN